MLCFFFRCWCVTDRRLLQAIINNIIISFFFFFCCSSSRGESNNTTITFLFRVSAQPQLHPPQAVSIRMLASPSQCQSKGKGFVEAFFEEEKFLFLANTFEMVFICDVCQD